MTWIKKKWHLHPLGNSQANQNRICPTMVTADFQAYKWRSFEDERQVVFVGRIKAVADRPKCFPKFSGISNFLIWKGSWKFLSGLGGTICHGWDISTPLFECIFSRVGFELFWFTNGGLHLSITSQHKEWSTYLDCASKWPRWLVLKKTTSPGIMLPVNLFTCHWSLQEQSCLDVHFHPYLVSAVCAHSGHHLACKFFFKSTQTINSSLWCTYYNLGWLMNRQKMVGMVDLVPLKYCK